MMHHAVDRHYFWSDAVRHQTELQNILPIKGRNIPPHELHTGEPPNVLHLRVWGCEAVSFVEKNLQYKFDDRTERCLYLGISQLHAEHTFKLLNLRSLQTTYRRNVKFDENFLPGRMDKKIHCAICFNKDDGESGEDEDDNHYGIFHPTASATNDRIRATDSDPCLHCT